MEDRRSQHPARRSIAVSLIGAALALVLVAPGAHARSAPRETQARGQSLRAVTLTSATVAHWGMVVRRVSVRVAPRASATVVTTLARTTSDGALSVVLVLEAVDRGPAETWYRIRLPILPNNSTGWVPRNALGKLTTVHTHLYVDRATLTATLDSYGKPVFTARIGVGREFWPTPRGEFYVRVKYLGFHNPAYGPVAFATSARSRVLTDWPGGGFVGIHGTNEPQILPGRVSHGCIRLRNDDMMKLARLMTIGTPLTIR
jgi:lipoprotein-anchoring transpeptidase ErfK/SrfK